MASFDIVCEINFQELNNALDQTRREIKSRYDFRGSNCEIDFDKKIPALTVTADDEFKMQTTIDILLTKLIKRSVPVKSLIYGKTGVIIKCTSSVLFVIFFIALTILGPKVILGT